MVIGWLCVSVRALCFHVPVHRGANEWGQGREEGKDAFPCHWTKAFFSVCMKGPMSFTLSCHTGMLHFEFLNLLLIRGRRLPWSAEMNQAPSLPREDFTTTTTPTPLLLHTGEAVEWTQLHAPGETFLMRHVPLLPETSASYQSRRRDKAMDVWKFRFQRSDWERSP